MTTTLNTSPKYYEVWQENTHGILTCLMFDAFGTGNKKQCEDYYKKNGGHQGKLALVYSLDNKEIIQ
jgi:hypothetical protein